MPDLAAATLAAAEDPLEEAAELYTLAAATIFLGRGGEHVTALEGSKPKEIAYVHAAGYPAGEFKHGPIALVTDHHRSLRLPARRDARQNAGEYRRSPSPPASPYWRRQCYRQRPGDQVDHLYQ